MCPLRAKALRRRRDACRRAVRHAAAAYRCQVQLRLVKKVGPKKNFIAKRPPSWLSCFLQLWKL